MERGVQLANEKIKRREERAAIVAEHYAQADQRYEALKATHDEMGTSLSSLKAEKAQAKETFDANTEQLLEFQTEQRKLKNSQKDNEKRRATKQAQINEERQRLEAADGGSEAAKRQAIENAEAKVAETREQSNRHPQGLAELERNRAEAEPKAKAAKDAADRKRGEINQAEHRLTELRRARPAPLAGFHPTLPRLLDEIQNERRFREKPIGPMGVHVRLLKPEWSSILEKYFGQGLNAFVVTSKSDQTILSAMLKRYQG